MSDLAGVLLARVDDALPSARDPARAVEMAAYLRNQFPFLGLSAPTRRSCARQALAGLGEPDEDDLGAVALACWERPEREFQQFGCDYLVRFAAVPGPGFLPVLATLITTKSWWDTVDPIATRVVAGLVSRHPSLVNTMDSWSGDGNMWLVRTAILHQLHYGAATDEERLFGYCTMQAGHHDFFVRKAIGWALRQYARTDPEAVRGFLAGPGKELSPLSVREASKHL